MDLKELLGKHGVDEETINSITADAEEQNLNVIVDNKNEPNFIPKSRFDEVNTQKNQFKTQVGELSDKLTTLKESTKGNEKFAQQIQDLQAEADKYKQQNESILLNSNIKLFAMQNNAINPEDIASFINKDELVIKGEEIIGLEDQINKIKESKPYLFNENKEVDKTEIKGVKTNATDGNPIKGKQLTMEDIDKMSVDEINDNWDAVQKVLNKK